MLGQVFWLVTDLLVELIGLIDILKQLAGVVQIEAGVVVLVIKLVDPHLLPDLMEVLRFYVGRNSKGFLKTDVVWRVLEICLVIKELLGFLWAYKLASNELFEFMLEVS